MGILDYLDLEADLDGEERLIRDTAREFVEEHVRPDIGEWFEAGDFPRDLVGEMGPWTSTRRRCPGVSCPASAHAPTAS